MTQSTTTKRLFALGMGACLAVSLSACWSGQTSQVTEDTPSASPVESVFTESADQSEKVDISCSADALNAYRGVLLDHQEFVLGSREEDLKYYEGLQETPAIIETKSTSLEQYLGDWAALNADTTDAVFRYFAFALCDLDADGAAEVILDTAIGSNVYVGRLILHYEDGVVYGYDVPYRGFNELKIDGTFTKSSGAYDNGSAMLSFQENTYSYDDITYCQSTYGDNREFHVTYFVNQVKTTEDAFNAAIEQQDQKPEVEWFDYTDNVVESVFAEFLH